jgi:hypothetical protein
VPEEEMRRRRRRRRRRRAVSRKLSVEYLKTGFRRVTEQKTFRR